MYESVARALEEKKTTRMKTKFEKKNSGVLQIPLDVKSRHAMKLSLQPRHAETPA